MVPGLQPLSERVGDGAGQPRLDSDAGEELMHVQPSVAVALGRRPPESPGTLYISTKRVIWLSDTNKSRGYAVDFLSISLHAVSRDPEAYPTPCIYTQVETEDDGGSESEGSDSDGTEDVMLSKISEMRLMPSDPSQLETLFDIFCRCAELNPEPNEDGEEENSWFFGGEEISGDGDVSEWQFSETLAPIGYANGNHDLAHTMLELQINDQRFEDAFEDAEEMEQEPHDNQQPRV
ncbi:chloride conductance regulatory protein ICln-like [Iris pallida]|uniref:Chloride conductance regulatory protein ICln-like n=1 Tax=Iris pallida TaxID=29817 RepID=A0AAX6G5A7_IRIPA|nr:chloride conductance regulatory protein ICln-like [Iris pallida]KAJ6823351.1 chloride conductance regulatory protein ICln-like [Iris pallida]